MEKYAEGEENSGKYHIKQDQFESRFDYSKRQVLKGELKQAMDDLK